MGMMKLGKTGGKRGLAIAGLIVGLVAVIMTVLLVMGIGKVQEKAAEAAPGLRDAFENALDTAKLNETMRQAMDSLNNAH